MVGHLPSTPYSAIHARGQTNAIALRTTGQEWENSRTGSEEISLHQTRAGSDQSGALSYFSVSFPSILVAIYLPREAVHLNISRPDLLLFAYVICFSLGKIFFPFLFVVVCPYLPGDLGGVYVLFDFVLFLFSFEQNQKESALTESQERKERPG